QQPTTLLTIRPFVLDLGGTQAAVAQASFSASGYALSLNGPAQIARLLALAHATGIPATAATVAGAAQVQVSVAGAWAGFERPRVTGSAELRAARFDVPGVAGGIE